VLQGLRWKFRTFVEDLLAGSQAGYRWYLRRRLGVTGPHGWPDAPWENAVLQSRAEVEAAVAQTRRLGLFLPHDRSKCWDSLAALDAILRRTGPDARVLDAGAALYSLILPWLWLYGYRRLIGINVEFKKPIRRGSIRYLPGDFTRTRFADATFDAVTCLSVIEHGVDLTEYFREMARILRPGGVLITSTDYFEEPLETGGREAYGTPVHVFCRSEIEASLALAGRYGFRLTGPLDLHCNERPVHWGRMGLDFTFVIFTLRKV